MLTVPAPIRTLPIPVVADAYTMQSNPVVFATAVPEPIVPGLVTWGGCDQKPWAMPKTAASTLWPTCTWPGYQFGMTYTTDASVASPAAQDEVRPRPYTIAYTSCRTVFEVTDQP